MSNGLELKNTLISGARTFSVDLTEAQIENFFKYKDILKEWNEKFNLTAIEEDMDIIVKHFLDSLSIIPFMSKYGKKSAGGTPAAIIDIGTGAGFPGIPLKNVCDYLDVTLVDSLDKRVKFLSEVIGSLKLKGIRAIHGRAEDCGMKQEYREKFDFAVARAVAALPVLLEYCLPFVKAGGIFIAMKGSNIDEVDSSKKALDILGGQIEEIGETALPFSDIKRNIIIVRKLRQTPTKYPRKAGKPSKEPLI